MCITIIGSRCVGLSSAIISHFLDYQTTQQGGSTYLGIGL